MSTLEKDPRCLETYVDIWRYVTVHIDKDGYMQFAKDIDKAGVTHEDISKSLEAHKHWRLPSIGSVNR